MSTDKSWIDDLRGKWLVVEGPDRIGKTTLINNFVEYLVSNGIEKEDVVTLAFPQRQSPIGSLLSKHLTSEISLNNKTQVMLFLADMLQTYTKISEAQNQNKIVICDRYTASTFSYALAQENLAYHSDMPIDWVKDAVSLVKQPNFYFFVLPVKEDIDQFFSRSGFGTERTETQAIQERVILYMKHYALTYVEKPTHKVIMTIKAMDTPSDVLNSLISRLAIIEFD
jgi:thymidylate kinase